MKTFRKLFGKKEKMELIIPISKSEKDVSRKNAIIPNQSAISISIEMGNLNFKKKYDEAIELGVKFLQKNPNSAFVHISLMVAYFKSRNDNPEYFDLSTYHAKQAIIYGHNTGYAHERLVINLEKSGMINQAIQLCDIVLSEKYHFSSHGCGKKEDFLFRKEKLRYKINSAKDNELKLFTDNEISLLYNNLELLEFDGIKSTYPQFTISNDEIELRIERIRDKENGLIKYVLPKQSTPYNIASIPLGVQYENTIKLLPEFNFYADLSENESQIDYLGNHRELINDGKYTPEIWRIRKIFMSLMEDAKKHESHGLLDNAAIIYEQLIAEQYWLQNPYNRLVKIYSKAKLQLDEIRVLEYAISHFSSLRNRQKEYIIQLATKCGKVDFAMDKINNNKKISYYGGSFELYNPYPIIDTWIKRLYKIISKEN